MVETNKILKLITYKLCKRKLKIINKPVTEKTQTGFIMYPMLGYSFIRLNIFEIETNLILLMKRNYSPDNALLGAILHEICHVKQWEKFKKNNRGIFKRYRWHKNYEQNTNYMEKVADRYAHFVLKIILKEVGLWKNTLNIS